MFVLPDDCHAKPLQQLVQQQLQQLPRAMKPLVDRKEENKVFKRHLTNDTPMDVISRSTEQNIEQTYATNP
jgi:hypothetical protein